MGEIGILNVGAGDTKLTFDKSNPAECIRSARIVTDMLHRGYALLVEHPPGSGAYTRVHEFNAETCEYIIADFDPIVAAQADATDGASHGRDNHGTIADEPQFSPKRTVASINRDVLSHAMKRMVA